MNTYYVVQNGHFAHDGTKQALYLQDAGVYTTSVQEAWHYELVLTAEIVARSLANGRVIKVTEELKFEEVPTAKLLDANLVDKTRQLKETPEAVQLEMQKRGW